MQAPERDNTQGNIYNEKIFDLKNSFKGGGASVSSSH